MKKQSIQTPDSRKEPCPSTSRQSTTRYHHYSSHPDHYAKTFSSPQHSASSPGPSYAQVHPHFTISVFVRFTSLSVLFARLSASFFRRLGIPLDLLRLPGLPMHFLLLFYPPSLKVIGLCAPPASNGWLLRIVRGACLSSALGRSGVGGWSGGDRDRGVCSAGRTADSCGIVGWC